MGTIINTDLYLVAQTHEGINFKEVRCLMYASTKKNFSFRAQYPVCLCERLFLELATEVKTITSFAQ